MTAKPIHTLLLVDDEWSIIRALQRLFRREGYHILTADNGQKGLELLKTYEAPVSMIISDQRMPEMNGAQFLEKAKELHPEAIRYLLTGYSDLDAVIQAVNRGEIHRYLTKPWNDEDLLLQVRQSLHYFELISENKRLTELTCQKDGKLSAFNVGLEQKVGAKTQETNEKTKALTGIIRVPENSYKDVFQFMASLVETLDPDFGRYMRWVARLVREVGQAMDMSNTELDQLEMAGMIHDIGLLGQNGALWCKQANQMDHEESRSFKEHPLAGAIILENVERLAGVGELVLHHHEYVNGTGFPNGLSDSQIPLGSRIILAVADYCCMVAGWQADVKKPTSVVREHFSPEIREKLAVSNDFEAVVAEAAQKNLFLDVGQKYDAQVVATLISTINKPQKSTSPYVIDLQALATGMTLMKDLRRKDGRLLLAKGMKLRPSTLRVIQIALDHGLINGKISIHRPDDDQV